MSHLRREVLGLVKQLREQREELERLREVAILVQGYAQLNNRISSQTFIGILGHPAGSRCTAGKIERSGNT